MKGVVQSVAWYPHGNLAAQVSTYRSVVGQQM